MTYAELKQYYNENPDFKRYVDEFCKARGISLEVALTLKMVENVALHYQGRLKGWD